jgi:hypothetical protein
MRYLFNFLDFFFALAAVYGTVSWIFIYHPATSTLETVAIDLTVGLAVGYMIGYLKEKYLD